MPRLRLPRPHCRQREQEKKKFIRASEASAFPVRRTGQPPRPSVTPLVRSVCLCECWRPPAGCAHHGEFPKHCIIDSSQTPPGAPPSLSCLSIHPACARASFFSPFPSWAKFVLAHCCVASSSNVCWHLATSTLAAAVFAFYPPPQGTESSHNRATAAVSCEDLDPITELTSLSSCRPYYNGPLASPSRPQPIQSLLVWSRPSHSIAPCHRLHDLTGASSSYTNLTRRRSALFTTSRIAKPAVLFVNDGG